MITRKVDNNDALAGFAYNWVKKLGERVEKLYVVSWQKSDPSGLPDNIEVISLPGGKFCKVWSLQWLLLGILPQIDGVFCHMNPEYTILSALLAKLFRKKLVTWYAHGSVSWKTKLVLILANKVVTSTDQGFRLKSSKVSIIGQGIDTEIFKPNTQIKSKNTDQAFEIITIGRISPTKDYESMIKAINLLVHQAKLKVKLKIIGGSGLKEQVAYLSSLQKMVQVMNLQDHVDFLGEVANKDIIPFLQGSDLFINLSQTGSLDKAILEAMACGTMVLTCNESAKNILPRDLWVSANQPEQLAERIKFIMRLSEEDRKHFVNLLRLEVVSNHNLDNLVSRVINSFK